jgi:glycosyltransferase involved in cell wall biosynthesis
MGLTRRVILVTSGQPSANPRLVKEAVTLEKVGYKVTVIYVPISPWADRFDKLLFQQYPQINFIRVGFHPKQQRILYKWARLRRKANLLISNFLGDTFNNRDFSTILFGQELFEKAKELKADLYIAHNLGALPAAVKAARFHKAKVGFDAEDFHRGEFIKDSIDKKQTEFIENKYFPFVNYLSVASPLISKAYKQIFFELSPVVINNVFPLSKLQALVTKSKTPGLHLFWFSQTIGKTRGLECVIEAIGLIRDLSIHFTMLGNASYDMKKHILQIASKAGVKHETIHFLAPVPEDELFEIASKFDVGLASEVPYCLNREYCLTNKIFTYLIAGNALALSDTKAQKQFLEEHPNIGMIYKYDDPASLAVVLSLYAENRDVLASHQKNARDLAEKKLNWEMESKKLLEVVQAVLNK